MYILSTGAPFQDQSNGNKSYILALGHHFETKTIPGQQIVLLRAGDITSRPRKWQQIVHWHWSITSRPLQQQQIVLLSTRASLRSQNNGNKSFFLAMGSTSRLKQRQQIVLLIAGASLRGPNKGNKSYFLALEHHFQGNKSNFLALRHHFQAKTKATYRSFFLALEYHCRGQNNGNQLYFLALGHHFRDQNNGNQSYVLVLGHHFDAKTTETNRFSWHWEITSDKAAATSRTS